MTAEATAFGKSEIINGMITATSAKKSDKFANNNETQSAYIVPVNDDEKAKLISFGLTEYTPSDKDALPYFIVKMVQKLRVYTSAEKGFMPEIRKTLISENPLNFKTSDNKVVSLEISQYKSDVNGNDFTRLSSVLLMDNATITEFQPENPFA